MDYFYCVLIDLRVQTSLCETKAWSRVVVASKSKTRMS